MKFKELPVGSIDLSSTVSVRLFEETCSEYKTFAFDIANTGATSMVISGFGGWDNLGQKLYSNVYSQIAQQTDFQNNLSAEAQSNLALRMRRFENISTSIPAGSIAAGATGTILTLIDDCQIFWCNGFRSSGSGVVSFSGIFKSPIEGVSEYFDVNSGGTTATPWIDCRAYGAMGFEIENTGSTTFTSLRVDSRRSAAGTVISTPYSGAAFNASNPILRSQRTRLFGANSAAVPGNKQISDFNIEDAHSIRFSVVPAGAFTVKGVLKG